jgi:hypothetical protein
MPLKKLTLKAGVNQENTRYTNENGWWATDKVRFRQGTPEKIGGWTRISANFFLGVCRSLWNWVTLGGANLVGVGTNLKFYIEQGGTYNDITPLRTTATLGTNPFTGNGTTTVTVAATAHGGATGDFVTFSGATGTYATLFNAEFQITVVTVDSYTITTASSVAAGASGGSVVVAAYQIPIGGEYAVPQIGWGAGAWNAGPWGTGASSLMPLRIWSQTNFGEDLIFGYRSGPIYYWKNSSGLTVRGVLASSLGGAVTFTSASPTVVTATINFVAGTPLQFSATGSLPTGVSAATTYYVSNVSGLTFNLVDSAGALINTSSTGSGVVISSLVDVPVVQNFLLVSDASRFVFAFGCNDYGSTTQNPMLLRWSDQENVTQWTPSATSQAGSLLLSHGSKIVTAIQTRQEILVYTDSTLYSLQYLGAPAVWGSQLLGDNISIAGENTVALASGVAYWMGVDKFYKYDGRIQTLRCDLRQFIYNDINLDQSDQFFASTNEGFNEVWFFYCTADSEVIDRYVVYNYVENNGQGVWYYGDMGRTAWLDSGLRNYPLAATYTKNLVNHELGVDDNTTATPTAIYSYVSSSEFDIDDGDRFGFVWRMLPDITFRGSTTANPTGTMTLIPMQNSGSGYNNPQSIAGSSSASVTRTATVPIEQFTGQVYVRVRGRQMIMQFENQQLGSTWQLGSPRIDIRQDGRRGNT